MLDVLKVLKLIVIKLLDYVYLLFIFTPVMVLLWFTSWNSMDFLLSFDKNNIISILVGFGGQLFIFLYYDKLNKIKDVKAKFLSIFLTSVHSFMCAVITICFWRIYWSFFDKISSNDDTSIVLHIIQNSIILMGLKVFVNTLSAPFIRQFSMIQHDSIPQSITYLRKTVSITNILLY